MFDYDVEKRSQVNILKN